MPAGSIVAPAPIVQISDRRSLDAIRVKQDPNTGADVEEHVNLLLLNYCFGHRNSSLLFFPYVSLFCARSICPACSCFYVLFICSPPFFKVAACELYQP